MVRPVGRRIDRWIRSGSRRGRCTTRGFERRAVEVHPRPLNIRLAIKRSVLSPNPWLSGFACPAAGSLRGGRSAEANQRHPGKANRQQQSKGHLTPRDEDSATNRKDYQARWVCSVDLGQKVFRNSMSARLSGSGSVVPKRCPRFTTKSGHLLSESSGSTRFLNFSRACSSV